ncbi:MAG TPA: CHAT domain-containing protein, partial [Candidatus Angelobacter sp.]
LVPGSLILANTLKESAFVPLQAGDPTAAEERLTQALAIQEKLAPGGSALAESLSYWSKALIERGDLAAAEERARRALAIREKLAPGGEEVALSLADLGLILRLRDDLARAAKCYSKALEIIIRISPGSIWASATLASLTEIAQEQGDLAKAELYARRALAITDKASPASDAAAFNKGLLGRIMLARGRYLEAEELFLKAQDIHRKSSWGLSSESKSNYDLGDVASAQGDLAEAEKRYRESLNAFEKLDTRYPARAEPMAALAGILRRTNRVEEAGKLYQQSLEIVERFASNLGGTELVRSHFRAKSAALYHEYIDLLVGQKDFEQAFHVLERWRARTLLETLGAGHVEIGRGADASLLRQERGLREAIAAKANLRLQRGQEAAIADKEISELLAKYDDVEAQIRNSGSNYAALTQPQALTVRQVQQQVLDDGTVLLEYSLGEERSYVFAVTSDSVAAYELPRKTEIEAMARQIYQVWTAQNRIVPQESTLQRQVRLRKAEKNSASVLAQLSRTILGPVASQLKSKRLLIVSDGALQYIPFAALSSPDSLDAGLAQDPVPLVAEHEIINLPSASVLATLRREVATRKKAPKAVAVLADPVFAQNDARVVGVAGRNPSRASLTTERTVKDEPYGQERAVVDSAALLTRSAADFGLLRRGGPYLPRLPFSRREAKAILSVTPKGQGMAALDFRASRATAVSPDLSQYRVLHFATHALLNSEHPELSGLVFSLVDPQGRPQSGFLGLEDVYNLNLSADLVVLSACETALGKDVQEEGLVGLTRGFMYAGASQVVASLWSVDDAATAELMRHFYKAMEQDGLRPAAALRWAQMEVRKQDRWSQPYYWAGFVIQGEWR